MLTYVVQEGQRVLIHRPNGKIGIVAGPKHLWQGRNTSKPIWHYVAYPGEDLIVRYREGRQNHLPGPAELWFDPRVHQDVAPEVAALRKLDGDLTAYVTQGRADRVIELRGSNGSAHVHLDPAHHSKRES